MSDMPADAPTSLLRRLFKYFAAMVILLIVVFLAATIYINWRGDREWQAFRSEWEAKGERFDFHDFIPTAIPDEQNFAATPVLATLTDFTKPPGQAIRWNNPQLKERIAAIGEVVQNQGRRQAPAAGLWQLAIPVDLIQWRTFLATNSTNVASSSREAAREILGVLKAFEAEFDELAVASSRPKSSFRLDYNENFRMLLPHLAPLKGIVQTLRLRAVSRLAVGQPDEAFNDVKLELRIVDALKSEPLLISQLVRIAMLQLAIQPIWEGAVRHEWSEEQLSGIQKALTELRLLEDYGRTIRAERAFGNAALDELRTGKVAISSFGSFGNPGDNEGRAMSAASRFVPSGWYRLNQLTLSRLYQERCLPLIDAEKRRVHVELAASVDDAPELRNPGMFNLFARLLFPAISKTASKFAIAQASIDLAVVACALERYRHKHGAYPPQLDPLVPELIERVPTDVISGELPKYRRETGGRFVLYSVGWNQLDDEGRPGASKSGNSVDARLGDWVWGFPAAP